MAFGDMIRGNLAIQNNIIRKNPISPSQNEHIVQLLDIDISDLSTLILKKDDSPSTACLYLFEVINLIL